MSGLWIKVCGLRDLREVEEAREAGADAIGLNLWPGSRRFVQLQQARELSAAAHAKASASGRQLVVVGVFVNAAVETTLEAVKELRLDAVQLHGEESQEVVRILLESKIKVIQAFRPASEEELQLARDSEASLLLLDAAGATRGGSGTTASWPLARTLRRDRVLLLAGGLDPSNVELAITEVRPGGVDLASGVEEPCPGSAGFRKSYKLMRRFVERAREAHHQRGDETAAQKLRAQLA